MRRRTYLITSIAALGLAGCSGDSGGGNSSGSGESTEASGSGDSTSVSEGGEETATSISEDTTEDSMSEDATSAISSGAGTETSEMEDAQSPTGTNTERETPAQTEMEMGTETQIQTSTATQQSSAGSGDVSLESQEIVDGVSLDSSEWYNEDNGISTGVRGEVTAEQDFDFLFIDAQIYDADDTRIGEGSDSSSDIPSGESLTFDCILVPDDPSAVEYYNIQITNDAM